MGRCRQHERFDPATAVQRIEVEDFPAFIVIDDKGNDVFRDLRLG